MATAQRDLWPPSFDTVAAENTPVAILREQAMLLEQKTNGLVLAEVRTGSDYNSGYLAVSGEKANLPLSHSFYLIAPALENYRYRLFRVDQAIELYPLLIKDGPIGEEEVYSEERFLEVLRKMFAAEKTQKVIQSLIAQSVS